MSLTPRQNCVRQLSEVVSSSGAFGLGVTQRWGTIALTLEAMRVGEQDEIPSYELPTKGYTDIGAHLEWQATMPNDQTLAVFLRGDNLSDTEQRYHTSFIKDLARSLIKLVW